MLRLIGSIQSKEKESCGNFKTSYVTVNLDLLEFDTVEQTNFKTSYVTVNLVQL